MSTIVTRAGKGSALTHVEADANFTNLNTDKVELTNLSATTAAAGTAGLAYDNTTGVFTFTPEDISDLASLSDFSVTVGAASGGGNLSYDNLTGAFTFNPADAADLISLSDLSVTTGAEGETAALSYDNTTGVFTFTPVALDGLIELGDLSATTAAPGVAGLTYNNVTGVFTFTPEDTSDLAALSDFSVTTAAPGAQGLSYNNLTGVFTFTPEDTSDLLGFTDLSATTAAPGTAGLTYNNVTGVFTFTPEDTSDLAALDDFSVTTGAASGAGALSYNNVTGVFTFNPVDTSLVLSNVVEDTTPQLGGDLDVLANIITSSTGDVAIEATGSNNVAIDTANGNINLATNSGYGVTLSYLKSYEELVRTNNSTTGSITLDHQAAPIDYIVQTGNITITGLDNPIQGASVTLILNNSGGAYTLSFAETNSTFYGLDGLDPTLTGFDMISMLCLDDTPDGEVYIVTHAGDFASI